MRESTWNVGIIELDTMEIEYELCGIDLYDAYILYYNSVNIKDFNSATYYKEIYEQIIWQIEDRFSPAELEIIRIDAMNFVRNRKPL